MNEKNIGKNIKKIRTERNIKQEYLAKKLNVSRPVISQYESGKTIPSLKTMIKLAEILQTTIDYLLTEHN